MRYLTGAAVALMVLSAAAQQDALQHFSGYQGDDRSCTLCLEEASSQTGCVYIDPSTPQFNFECLCLPASQATTQGCAGFCQDTAFSAEAQCLGTYELEKRDEEMTSAVSVAPRAPQSPTTQPGFGFCGPKGVSCKSTEYAGPPLTERATAESPLPARAAIVARGKAKGKKTSSRQHPHPGMQTAFPTFNFCGVSGSSCATGNAENNTSAITTTTDHSQQPTAVLDKRDGLLLENKKGGGGGRGGGGGAGGGHSGAVAQLNNAHAFAALPLLALAVLI